MRTWSSRIGMSPAGLLAMRSMMGWLSRKGIEATSKPSAPYSSWKETSTRIKITCIEVKISRNMHELLRGCKRSLEDKTLELIC